VIYFVSVLPMGGILILPNHTRVSAVTCICLESSVGLVYSGSLAIRRGGISYVQSSDLFPYVVFPFAAFALMVLAASCCLVGAKSALTW